jgi:hypothetical protein
MHVQRPAEPAAAAARPAEPAAAAVASCLVAAAAETKPRFMRDARPAWPHALVCLFTRFGASLYTLPA